MTADPRTGHADLRHVSAGTGYPSAPAARTLAGQVPAVGPVVGCTLVFGPFGAISAARRADRARALGVSGRKYWIAFGVALAAGCAVAALVVVAGLEMGIDSLSLTSHKITPAWLARSIVQDGTFTDGAGETVKAGSAVCNAEKVDSDGAGTYRCTIAFAGNDRESFVVAVDAAGRWATGRAGTHLP